MAGCECCDNFSMIDGGDEFKAFPGLKGDDGTTFYPHVSAEGVLSWTNDGGKPNPAPVNIKGADGKSAYQAAVEAGFSGTEEEFGEYLSGIGDLTDEVADQKSAFEFLSPELTIGANLFDYNSCELGSFNSSGVEVDSTTAMRTTVYAPIPTGATQIVGPYTMRHIFYDNNKVFIARSASGAGPFDIPSGAAFVRTTLNKAVYDQHPDIMVNIGNTVLPYEPFIIYRTIDEESFEQALKNCDLNTAQEYYMQLYKVFKRVGVCGDSLSVGYTKDPVSSTVLTRNLPYSWVKCAGRDAHAYWLNFGTTGQNVLTWCSSATYGKVQMEAENNKCQAYIIGLGENDQAGDTPLGTTADIVNDPDTVATTYYGGYARIIQLLKRRNADAKIFCFTNPRENASRKQYNDAVRYIAETYYTTADNVFLVDLAKDYGWLFTAGNPLYIDKQAVSHYSSLGYQMLSKINEEAISRVMLKNQLSFLAVPFIPYDTGEPTANTMTE